jgi:Phage integrase family
LIRENRAISDLADNSDGRPLFRRDTKRGDIDENGPLWEYRFHYLGTDLNKLVSNAVKKLNVVSTRTGQPIKVSVRRLRYTFATRLVREGASPRVLADALDHTDLQHIRVYFDIKSDIVEKLDAAMALELGPLSQAFLGHIVRSEVDAERGDFKGSRIYHADRRSRTLEPLGTCGSFSFCGLAAPLACYTCIKFQPWMNAPHDKALAALLDERQRRLDEGQDGKMISLFDNTIMAIADVIKRIEAINRTEGDGVN